MSKAPNSETRSNLWSTSVNGVSGRLRLELEDLNPGLRFAVHMETLNRSFDSITITNQPAIRAELVDDAGKEIQTVAYPASGPIPPPQWAVVPHDAYVGFRIDMQTVGVPSKEQRMVLLAVGGITWRLSTGRYLLKTTAIFKNDVDGPANQWVGELELPTVEVVVTDEMFSE